MFEFLADSLSFFYSIWRSYAGAIILFTLAIMLILTPLSIKTTRSMIAMQRVGPELKKLQAKYKDDRETLNKEMMSFYKENNINPFSSCLPMLLQMPVFFVLYRVLQGLTRRDPDTGLFNPEHLENSVGNLAEDLRSHDEMLSFGIDLSQSMMERLSDNWLAAVPYALLVGAVVATAFVQQRQIQGRNTGAVNPQQQMIGRIMPFIFIPISVSIPAGVVIYFVVSNTVRIGQQALVTRLEYGDKADAKRALAQAKTNGEDGDKAIETTSTEKKNVKPAVKSVKPPVKATTNGRQSAGSNGGGRSATSARAGTASQSRSRKKKKRK